MTPNPPPSPPRPRRTWRSQAVRALVYQVIAVGLTALLVLYVAHNTASNMEARGIRSGFGFMSGPAGFDIGESILAFDSGESYWRAYLIGLTNTLRVAVLAIVLTTLLGTLVGVGRLSRNVLVRGLCRVYVELFRNVPLLLQLLMWYLLFTELLPDATAPWSVGPLFLSKGGLSYPIPVWEHGYVEAVWGALAGLVCAWLYRRSARHALEVTGQIRSRFWLPLGLVLAGTLLGWVLGGAPHQMDIPIQGEFAVEHGGALTPEFMALLLGLSVYTAAFVAEAVRGGLQSVPAGQTEAAMALGLGRAYTTRLVLLPQAMRVIIPPVTNQYLNLTKNSSLAVAIGYPDIVSIANTTINQTGRAVECITLIMVVYLGTSLATSWLMGRYQKRMALRER